MATTEVDWRKIINGLKRHGFTLDQVGMEIGVTRRTVHNWREGFCEPSYTKGAKLLSVFSSVVKST